ncbi:hypothetical protein L249_4445 [Ophiocordyceps polyrhachis-furcata BCC 54312]|uniref:Uncharacterized protein n=1 Tax=Ophiocordyceps polyrhachis-furcata BCC 54312 TaxID=1330021 RepID=A0A367L898_9HYPO|nr:hypothetical protein L249_4445 [Ophiocordyceps polyrhachis-furcata BCC 54312]
MVEQVTCLSVLSSIFALPTGHRSPAWVQDQEKTMKKEAMEKGKKRPPDSRLRPDFPSFPLLPREAKASVLGIIPRAIILYRSLLYIPFMSNRLAYSPCSYSAPAWSSLCVTRHIASPNAYLS